MGQPRRYENIGIAERIVPRWDNSSGPGYMGGCTLSGEQGTTQYNLYGNEADGYNRPAQIAATLRFSAELSDPNNQNREIIANSYMGDAANRHDMAYWYAENERDNAVQAHFPDKTTWNSLSADQQRSEAGRQISHHYNETIYEADIALLQATLSWQPENAIGQAYRSLAIEAFKYKAMVATGGQEFNRRFNEEDLPALRAISPDIDSIPILGALKQGISADGLRRTSFEELTTLPLSEREMGFFNSHLTTLNNLEGMRATPVSQGNYDPPSIPGMEHKPDVLVVPRWEPNPAFPAEQPGAQNHGRFIWEGTLDGKTVSMVLDLDDDRKFTQISTDRNNNQETTVYQRHPESEWTQNNYFTPSYHHTVITTAPDGHQLSSTADILPAGPTYPHPASFQGKLADQYNQALDAAASNPQVRDQMSAVAQNMDAQRLYNRLMASGQTTQSLDNFLTQQHNIQLNPASQAIYCRLKEGFGNELKQLGVSEKHAEAMVAGVTLECVRAGIKAEKIDETIINTDQNKLLVVEKAQNKYIAVDAIEMSKTNPETALKQASELADQQTDMNNRQQQEQEQEQTRSITQKGPGMSR